ncbi:MAG: alpha/beta hydrolase, partial [Clostridia bacterium]|nr:alpha/beta hydrolase [Clostridia bacterium]
MSRKKKIILSIVLCLVILLVGGLIWGGDYLVTFAIARSTGLKNIAPESTLSEDATQGIIQNWQQQAQQAKDWMEKSIVETVQLRSADGLKLNAEAVITDAASHLWVIAVHGYRGSHAAMTAMASYYGLKGWNALLPDLRGYGDSEGDYIGMGWPDRRDMLQWIDWIIARDRDARIVLHGISMGGATVMMTAGETLPDQAKAVVEDCGYT